LRSRFAFTGNKNRESTSHEELLSKVRHLRMIADKKIREILSDVQKKKLDQCMAT